MDKFENTNVPVASTAYRPPGARGQPASAIFSGETSRPRIIPGQKSSAKKVVQAQIQVVPDVILVDTEKLAKEKKIKLCVKKLKQIEELKQRLKRGEVLELTQTSKIANEDALRIELDNLHL